jgi:hypothetical protein
MKKIITFLAVVGMFSIQSCTVSDNTPIVDNDTISEVFEVTTSFNSTNNYTSTVSLFPAIYSSDVVLVYHLYGVVNGEDVWRLMPQTYYMSDGGALDYNFDFTVNRVKIFLGADFNLNTLSSTWTQNQTFRIVIVPAGFSASINKNSYPAVTAALNINESQIQKINF